MEEREFETPLMSHHFQPCHRLISPSQSIWCHTCCMRLLHYYHVCVKIVAYCWIKPTMGHPVSSWRFWGKSAKKCFVTDVRLHHSWLYQLPSFVAAESANPSVAESWIYSIWHWTMKMTLSTFARRWAIYYSQNRWMQQRHVQCGRKPMLQRKARWWFSGTWSLSTVAIWL
jgi:hypothetical protein